ncbi:MAG TPA: zinc ribbon domain-containing protein [Smithellaceae bacterium]|jgi:hypothetical protein|nr:zinc ribbon domain-containing protein [Syntrophaceae bacterium]HPV49729.1 zinc ribbon domain-containing protein [Smithellaceae bacterium]
MAAIFPIIMKIVSVVFLVIFILSVVLLIFTFRKPRKVSVFSLFLPILISLITFAVFSFFISYKPSIAVLVLMGGIGLCIGIVWSGATRIYVENGTVKSLNSIWYLVAWGAVFALTQMISIITQRPPSIVMALLVMSTGTIIGMNGRIAKKYLSVRSTVNASGEASSRCSHCGAAKTGSDVFCRKCGTKL